MIDEIFKNYEVFYNMVLSTTIMSNARSEQLTQDSKKIIDFIGKSYELGDEFINDCADIIINELSSLGKTTDQLAVYANRSIDEFVTDSDSLFDIKGDVLATLQSISEIERKTVNPGWFDYTHYKSYQPDIRYTKIYMTSVTGNLTATRQVGILLSLGIGCKKSYDCAVKRLLQCAQWGDIPAMHYLTYVYKLNGDEKNYKLFKEITEISEEYLRTGVTILPDEVIQKYSKEACEYYTCIASILLDVIYLHEINNTNNIKFSFLEAVFSPTLNFYERMDYINNYSKLTWKYVTNPTAKSSAKLGFKN